MSADTALSAVIKADVASVSAVIKTDALSADTALSAVIKTDINSVSAAILQGLSVQQGAGQYRMVTNNQTLSTGTFTKVASMSLSLGGSNFYVVHGQLNYTGVGGGSATAVFQLGMSCTSQPIYASFKFVGTPSGIAASSQISAVQFGGESAISGTPSVMFSIKPGVSGQPYAVFFDGVTQCSTAAGIFCRSQ